MPVDHTPHATHTEGHPMSKRDRTYAERHAAPETEQTPVMLTTRWVCGEHTEQSVRPTGKGCPVCAKARRDLHDERTGKRIERRQKAADRARVGS
jgi:hypothetical protein